MNPEFQRNIWLEIPPHRLVAMPAVLVLIFLAAWIAGGTRTFPVVAQLTLGLILIIWGSRLAADSVLGEVQGRTWDAQRMSAITPWEMAWGKLFGSTIYVWYGALFCVIAFFFSDQGRVVDLVRVLLAGLQAQALAMLLSLLTLRRGVEGLQFQVFLSQGLAILVVLPFHALIPVDPFGYVSWYGYSISQSLFLITTQVAFICWTILGIYRLMRTELQYRTSQAAWLGFVVFMIAYVAGIDGLLLLSAAKSFPGLFSDRLFQAFCVAIGLTYVAAFVEPKGLVRLRSWVQHTQRGRMNRVAEMTTSWFISGIVAAGLGVATLVNVALAPQGGMEALGTLLPFMVAILLFVIRDIAVLHYLVLHERARRGHIAAALYLIAVYFLAPIGLDFLNLDQLLPIFIPTQAAPALLVVGPVLLQTVLALALVLRRWRAAQFIEYDRPGAYA